MGQYREKDVKKSWKQADSCVIRETGVIIIIEGFRSGTLRPVRRNGRTVLCSTFAELQNRPLFLENIRIQPNEILFVKECVCYARF